MKLSIKNWNKEAGSFLTLAMVFISTITAFSDEFLIVLHQAPFPVSPKVDEWVEWILKITTFILGFITVASKRVKSAGQDLTTTTAPDR